MFATNEKIDSTMKLPSLIAKNGKIYVNKDKKDTDSVIPNIFLLINSRLSILKYLFWQP